MEAIKLASFYRVDACFKKIDALSLVIIINSIYYASVIMENQKNVINQMQLFN